MKNLKALWIDEKYFIFLFLLSLLFGVIRINFILGITISFSSVFFLIITKKFGLKKGLITVVLVEGLTYILYGNIKILILKVLEVLFLNYVLKKNKTEHLILIDLVYWCIIFVFGTAIHGFLIQSEFGFKEFYFNAFKLGMNSMINSEIADVILVFFPMRNIIRKRGGSIVSFKNIIFHAIIIMVLFPYIISITLGTIKQYEAIIKTNGKVADNIKINIEEYLSTWDELKKEKLILNSKIEVGELRNKIIQATGDNEYGVIIKDDRNRLLMSNNRNYISIDEYRNAYYMNKIYKNAYEVVIDSGFNKGEIVYEYKMLNGRVTMYVNISIVHVRGEIIVSLLSNLIVFFLLTILAICGGSLINGYLNKSINRLIVATGNTQRLINSDNETIVLKSNIEEINVLEQNYGNMLIKLREYFNEIEESKRELEKLAYTDYLTGLNNRLAFSRDLDKKSNGLKSGVLALVLLDINKFKEINDTLGHATGDLVLIGVSKRLMDLKRAGFDIYRQGGDEIAILIEGKSRDEIKEEINRVGRAFDLPFNIFQGERKIYVSIGASIYPEDTVDLEELMRFSDIAMYRAKTEKSIEPILYK